MAWPVEPFSGYIGAHAVKSRLTPLQLLPLQGEVGFRHIAAGSDGKFYTALESGKILLANLPGYPNNLMRGNKGRFGSA